MSQKRSWNDVFSEVAENWLLFDCCDHSKYIYRLSRQHSHIWFLIEWVRESRHYVCVQSQLTRVCTCQCEYVVFNLLILRVTETEINIFLFSAFSSSILSSSLGLCSGDGRSKQLTVYFTIVVYVQQFVGLTRYLHAYFDRFTLQWPTNKSKTGSVQSTRPQVQVW